ncbi:MAG: metal-dependent hydrolase [Bacteroidia bacterium]
MDSLTQIVLGAAVGEVVLGKKAGNRAPLWGAIAGTIPDLDVFVKFFVDDLRANELHRGFSHSIVFCLIAAPFLGYLIHLIYKKKALASWRNWTMLSFWAFFTHPLLDAHTTWGTQLFWPFDLRIAYKNISAVDPLYTLPFLLLLLIVLFMRRTSPWRRKLTWLGIAISTSYLVYTIGLKFHVDRVFKSQLAYNEIPYTRYTHQPTIMNSFLWQVTAETDSAYHIGVYSILDENQDIEFWSYPKNLILRDILINDYTPYVQRLANLSDGWFLLESQDGKYVFRDLRFGQISFGANKEDVVFAYNILVQSEEWSVEQIDPPRDKMRSSIAALFHRVKGNKEPLTP